jgi:hypothetical protein
MASYTLLLYKALGSIYDLDVAPLSIDYTPMNSYIREEARLIIETPLAIMPPPSYMSDGSSLKSMACSNVPKGGAKEKRKAFTHPTTYAIGLKWKATDSSKPSKHSLVTPLGTHASSSLPSARPSPSYTIIGMCKPDGRYWKALMHKLPKKLVCESTPSGKGLESSSSPHRIKRIIKPQIRGQPAGFPSESEDEQPSKGPMLASLSTSNRSLRVLGRPMFISLRVF